MGIIALCNMCNMFHHFLLEAVPGLPPPWSGFLWVPTAYRDPACSLPETEGTSWSCSRNPWGYGPERGEKLVVVAWFVAGLFFPYQQMGGQVLPICWKAGPHFPQKSSVVHHINLSVCPWKPYVSIPCWQTALHRHHRPRLLDCRAGTSRLYLSARSAGTSEPKDTHYHTVTKI